MGDPAPPAEDNRRIADPPARWIGPGAVAAPLILEGAAIALLFMHGDFGWFLGLLFLGVPFAYLMAAGVLVTEERRRYAAVAVALAPISAVLNGLFVLSLCQSAITNNHGGTLP